MNAELENCRAYYTYCLGLGRCQGSVQLRADLRANPTLSPDLQMNQADARGFIERCRGGGCVKIPELEELLDQFPKG